MAPDNNLDFRADFGDAAKMAEILKKAPEGKRELARLALTFYSRGMSDCLALDMRGDAPRPTA